MVAYVLAAKYAWHLPLYRQAQILLSQGCAFRRSRPLVPTHRDHPFRTIATSMA